MKVGNNSFALAEMVYDELGQLKTKKLHNNMEQIDYQYNIRGWLTRINNPANLANDHFAMALFLLMFSFISNLVSEYYVVRSKKKWGV